MKRRRFSKVERRIIKKARLEAIQATFGNGVRRNAAERFWKRVPDSHHRWSALGTLPDKSPTQAVLLYLKRHGQAQNQNRPAQETSQDGGTPADGGRNVAAPADPGPPANEGAPSLPHTEKR